MPRWRDKSKNCRIIDTGIGYSVFLPTLLATVSLDPSFGSDSLFSLQIKNAIKYYLSGHKCKCTGIVCVRLKMEWANIGLYLRKCPNGHKIAQFNMVSWFVTSFKREVKLFMFNKDQQINFHGYTQCHWKLYCCCYCNLYKL